jgi:NTP pyrophosphatase (non-canonical NTP hydrolase)
MPFKTIREAAEAVLAYRDERNWKQFHSPQEMAIALCSEAAEVLEPFRWLQGDQIQACADDQAEHLGEELADVTYCVILFWDALRVDLIQALDKIHGPLSLDTPFELVVERVAQYGESIQAKNGQKALAVSISISAGRLLDGVSGCYARPTEAIDYDKMTLRLLSVLVLTILLSRRLGRDLMADLESKLAKNAIRFPVEKWYGKNSKYLTSQHG